MIRKELFGILIFILIIANCKRTSESIDSSTIKVSQEAEKELIEIVMKIWEDAVNGDTSALKELHLKSPKFTKFGPRINTRQDVESTIKTETEHFSSISDAEFIIEDLKVDVFGDVAITTFYNNYSFIKDSAKVKGKGRITLAFLRTDEGWKIIHEHSSPFEE